MNEHRCHYTGQPAYAAVSGGFIHAGYGSSHDLSRYVFAMARPDDLSEGAWLDSGRTLLTGATLARAFEANRTWAARRVRQFTEGTATPAEVPRMFLSWDRAEADPVRLALAAALAEAIVGRPVTLKELTPESKE